MTCEASSTVALPNSGKPDWQSQFRHAIRDPQQLCERLELDESYWAGAAAAAKLFPVFAPENYIARMERGNPHDPLLRQVLPVAEEGADEEGFTKDPVGDAPAKLRPGLLQKYAGRALLITTGACAIHCRYCFRRHYAYDLEPKSLDAWEPAAQQIAADASIEELILSGGDPLTLSDGRLRALVSRFARIPHLRRLRVHTRLPVVIPARVTSGLVEWLTGHRLTPYLVLHVNHARELSTDVLDGIALLRRAGVVLLNQTVLLRGVNDSLEDMLDLCRKLSDHGVAPYYLHQLDRVAGAAHFEVAIARGLQLIEQLRAQLPGYAVPRYVQEQLGATSKVLLA
jgi:EF-P beta-lysylation protein EpmB